jgi:hypothetical protein
VHRLGDHAPAEGDIGVRVVAEAVHEVRRARRAGRKRMPPFEDTLFTVMLAAFAMLAQAVVGSHLQATAGIADDARAPARFRAWLARLMVEHFEKD